jgi:uncharacterized Fe-S cluster protein YjdI
LLNNYDSKHRIMSENKIYKYSNGDLSVVWEPKLCIHAENCVQSLPKVYRPDERPWINPKEATADELIEQIETCPSGALSYIDHRK